MSEGFTPREAAEESANYYKSHKLGERLKAEDPEDWSHSTAKGIHEDDEQAARKAYEAHPDEYRLAGIAHAALDGVVVNTGSQGPAQPNVDAEPQ